MYQLQQSSHPVEISMQTCYRYSSFYLRGQCGSAQQRHRRPAHLPRVDELRYADAVGAGSLDSLFSAGRRGTCKLVPLLLLHRPIPPISLPTFLRLSTKTSIPHPPVRLDERASRLHWPVLSISKHTQEHSNPAQHVAGSSSGAQRSWRTRESKDISHISTPYR